MGVRTGTAVKGHVWGSVRVSLVSPGEPWWRGGGAVGKVRRGSSPRQGNLKPRWSHGRHVNTQSETASLTDPRADSEGELIINLKKKLKLDPLVLI